MAVSRDFPRMVQTAFASGFPIKGYKLKCHLVMEMWIQHRQIQLHIERTHAVHTTSGGISTVKGFSPLTVRTDVLVAYLMRCTLVSRRLAL